MVVLIGWFGREEPYYYMVSIVTSPSPASDHTPFFSLIASVALATCALLINQQQQHQQRHNKQQQQTTNNKQQQTINNKQTTNNKIQNTNNKIQTTNNKEQTTSNTDNNNRDCLGEATCASRTEVDLAGCSLGDTGYKSLLANCRALALPVRPQPAAGGSGNFGPKYSLLTRGAAQYRLNAIHVIVYTVGPSIRHMAFAE